MGFQCILGHGDRGSGTREATCSCTPGCPKGVCFYPQKWPMGTQGRPFGLEVIPGPLMAWGATIPSLSGPTLTQVLILSVDPKQEDWKQEGVGGEGGKGVSRSLAWQAVQAATTGGPCVPSPLTHTLCKRGGRAACSLSRASRLLPASRALRAGAIPGLGASQRAGKRHPRLPFHLPLS